MVAHRAILTALAAMLPGAAWAQDNSTYVDYLVQSQPSLYPQTLATIFSDNNNPPTALTNPFTGNTDGSWGFYAGIGHYDIVLSGGQKGGFPTPFPLTDVLLQDCSTEQCAGPGNPSAPAFSIQVANSSVNTFTSEIGRAHV